tara:strand:- start:24567 stop:25070 length:504 start_codon:yes stop_codon:yes gene_type:complete
MKQRGFMLNLPSLVIALALSAIVTLSTFQSTRTELKLQSYDGIDFSARIIGKAINGYYLNHCSDSSFSQPTLAGLKSNYIQNPSVVETPENIAFVPSVSGVGTEEVTYYVTANMPDSATAKWFERKKSNTSVTNTQVQWAFRPTLSSETNSIRYRQLRAAYGNDDCK